MTHRVLRHDPRLVRQVLAYAETHNACATGRKYGIHHNTVQRWQQYRAEKGLAWPTDQDITNWDNSKPERARNAARKRREAVRRHFNAPPVLIDATGTIRRLQALGAIGHAQRDIGDELGLSDARISQLATGKHTKVFPETAEAVAQLYRRWAMTPSTKRGAAMVRQHAARRGWVSAIFWDNIDDPNSRPSHTRTTPDRAKAAA